MNADLSNTDPCFPAGDAMLSMDDALDYLLRQARPIAECEDVALRQAFGRVLALDVVSRVDVPPADNSSMDGYALRAEDVAGAGEEGLPVSQRIVAGSVGEQLAARTAARIFTGAPIPPGADCVVMQEYCEERAGRVHVRPGPQAAPQAGDNIRRRGEDMLRDAPVLRKARWLRAQDIGLAAAAGVPRLTVTRRARVVIFSTGDELAEPGEDLRAGQIYNSNRYMLHGLLTSLGCEIIDLGTVADDLAATRELLRRAAREADVIITSGGVSVGEEDYVKLALEQLGELRMWKVAMKPGKPVAYGRIGEAAFIGLPGNPVSVFVTFCLFARPFLLRTMGMTEVLPMRFPLRADFDWPRVGPRREFARARAVMGEDGVMRARLYPRQGSGVLTSTVWADGLVLIPENESIKKGDTVSYLSFSEISG